MADWPATLPQYLLANGAQRSVADNLLESKTDSNVIMTRRRFSQVAKPITGSILVTKEQLDIFLEFFETTLLDGSLPFNIPDQEGDAGTWLVKFQKEALPTWQREGAYRRISFGLWIMP